jgi:hypothetical protein
MRDILYSHSRDFFFGLFFLIYFDKKLFQKEKKEIVVEYSNFVSPLEVFLAVSC